MNYNKKYIYNSTIRSLFNKICSKYPNNIFLTNNSFLNDGKIKEYTYESVKKYISKNIYFLKKNNFFIGDRIAIMVGNSAEYFILKLSFNYYGLSCVPINMDLSTNEIIFILNNSNSKYLICLDKKVKHIKNTILKRFKRKIGLLTLNSNNEIKLVQKINISKIIANKKLNSKTESSILYTSGTTGVPKGCILS